LAVRRVERATGLIDGHVEVPCGARLASKCKPCANRNRKLRQRQIREGWHLTEEPTVVVEKPTAEVVALLHERAELFFDREMAVRVQDWPMVQAIDLGLGWVDEMLAGQRLRGTLPEPDAERKARAVRSTRRRRDVVGLPRLKVENRSIGRLYISRDGTKTYNHSQLLTATLPGFGPVHHRPGQL
jgi:hypothetical protein